MVVDISSSICAYGCRSRASTIRGSDGRCSSSNTKQTNTKPGMFFDVLFVILQHITSDNTMCVVHLWNIAYLQYFCITQSRVNCMSKDWTLQITVWLCFSSIVVLQIAVMVEDATEAACSRSTSRISSSDAAMLSTGLEEVNFLFLSTAASTSLQMTQSISTSASVTAGVGSTEPTSPGLQVPSDHSQGKHSSWQSLVLCWFLSLAFTSLLLLADLYQIRFYW